MNNLKNWLKKRKYRYKGTEEFDIDIVEMEKKISQGAILIDVRSPQEYNEGHINGAILIPSYEIKKRINNIITDKNQPIIVYCSTGARSKKTQKELNKNGYTNVYNLRGELEI